MNVAGSVFNLEENIRDFREEIRGHIWPFFYGRKDFLQILSDTLRIYALVCTWLAMNDDNIETLIEELQNSEIMYAEAVTPKFIEDIKIAYPERIAALNSIIRNMVQEGCMLNFSDNDICEIITNHVLKIIDLVSEETVLVN